MLNNRPLVAFIPVRGGSKGIPGKNLLPLAGLSLLGRTIAIAKACPKIDHVFVSTDDSEMYEIAKQNGVQTPAPRPAHLATDTAKTVDVLTYHIQELGIADNAYILLLQTTCPLRTLADLDQFLAAFEADKAANSMVSLTALSDPHPGKVQKIENGVVASFLGGESMVARQSLPQVYRLNGAFYITDAKHLREQQSFFVAPTKPFVMDALKSVNLDTMIDLYLMETLISKGIVTGDWRK